MDDLHTTYVILAQVAAQRELLKEETLLLNQMARTLNKIYMSVESEYDKLDNEDTQPTT